MAPLSKRGPKGVSMAGTWQHTGECRLHARVHLLVGELGNKLLGLIVLAELEAGGHLHGHVVVLGADQCLMHPVVAGVRIYLLQSASREQQREAGTAVHDKPRTQQSRNNADDPDT